MNPFDIMKVMNSMNTIAPKNNVALFIEETYAILFPDKSVKELAMLKGILVSAANEEPQKSLQTMIQFKNLFESWYMEQIYNNGNNPKTVEIPNLD